LSIKDAAEKILSVALPNTCAICGRAISPFRMICQSCESDIKRRGPNLSLENHKGFYLAYYGFYEGILRDLIISYKSARWRLGKILSNLCINTIEKLIEKPFDVAYIPATLTSLEERGLDHVKLIAKEVSKYFNAHLVKSLYPVTEDKQSGKSRQERKKVKEKYIFRGNMKNKRLVLIDDVYTTGTTVRNAIDAFRKVENDLEIYTCVIAKVKRWQG